jgi:hypothetical protein
MGPWTTHRHLAAFWPLYLLTGAAVGCAIFFTGLGLGQALILAVPIGLLAGVFFALLHIRFSRQS